MDINADVVYGYAEYNFKSFLRSAFIEVRQTTENAAPTNWWREDHQISHGCRGQLASQKFEKTVQNAASDGFGSKFSGAAFCLLHQLVGFLLGKTRRCAFWPFWDDLRRRQRRSSSSIKCVSRISRERFGLESPNFLGTSFRAQTAAHRI